MLIIQEAFIVEDHINNQKRLSFTLIWEESPDCLKLSTNNCIKGRVVYIFDTIIHKIDLIIFAESMPKKQEVSWSIDSAICFNLHIENCCILRRYQSLNSNFLYFCVPVFKGLNIDNILHHSVNGEAEIHKDFEVLCVSSALQQPILVLVFECLKVILRCE